MNERHLRRDFENALVVSIERQHLRLMLEACHKMHSFWAAPRDEDAAVGWDSPENLLEMKRSESNLMTMLKTWIEVEAAPAVLVGFGRSGFVNKLRTLLHGQRLQHFTYQSLHTFLLEFVTTMQDYGAEHQVSRLQPVRLKDICPHFQDTPAKLIAIALDHGRLPPRDVPEDPQHEALVQPEYDIDVFEDVPSQPEYDIDVLEDVPSMPSLGAELDAEVFESCDCPELSDVDDLLMDFSHTLETPPSHHISDTVVTGLGDVCPHWNTCIETSIAICTIIRKRSHKARLLESCFSTGIAIHFQDAIRKFKGFIHTKRWATLVFSIPELKRVERGMRLFYDKRKFQSCDRKQPAEILNLAEVVGEGVKSPEYWAYLVVQEELACFERRATTFFEVCPCHGLYILRLRQGPPDEVVKHMTGEWSHCPFRGMMVAELAEEFFVMLNEALNSGLADLLAKLPIDISEEVRRMCLVEFEAGRNHLVFVYTLKLSHLHNAPFALFKMASLDLRKAHAAGDTCILSNSAHPRILELQRPPLRDQFIRWKAGANLFSDELAELCDFIAQYRFALSTDRPGEVLLCVELWRSLTFALTVNLFKYFLDFVIAAHVHLERAPGPEGFHE
jgi:hypothetical protein